MVGDGENTGRIASDDIPGPASRIQVPCEYGETALEILRELRRRYGDVVRYWTAFGRGYLLTHPRDVRDVLARHTCIRTPLVKAVLGDGLLSSDSPHWRRQRGLIAPEFEETRMLNLVPVFRAVFEDRMETWPRLTLGDEPLNLAREMELAALENGTRGLFSTSLEDRFLDDFSEVLRQLGEISFGIALGARLVRGPDVNRIFQQTMGRIEEDVAEIIAARRNGGEGPSDLLGTLLSARKGSDTGSLTDRQIRDEVLTMLVASHETTAVTMTWAWYLLATHPEVEAEFHREVDSVLDGRPIEAEDIARLPYTRMVLDETLRLYPPVWLIVREVLRDDVFGGHSIAAGSGVVVSPYLVHRHEEYWEEPDSFDPRRFEGGEGGYVGAYAYLPFASGRHTCLGRFFALTEVVVGLATIAQRTSFRLRSTEAVEVEPLLTLRVRGGLWVDLIPRSGGPKRERRK